MKASSGWIILYTPDPSILHPRLVFPIYFLDSSTFHDGFRNCNLMPPTDTSATEDYAGSMHVFCLCMSLSEQLLLSSPLMTMVLERNPHEVGGSGAGDKFWKHLIFMVTYGGDELTNDAGLRRKKKGFKRDVNLRGMRKVTVMNAKLRQTWPKP